MSKKIWSCVLILIMLFNISISFCTVFATTEDVMFNITGPTTIHRGETVSVTVSAAIAADTAVQGVQVDFLYSNNFPGINPNPVISTNTIGWGLGGFGVGITKNNLLGFGAVNSAGGLIEGVLTFDIPNDVPFGTVYTIELSDATVVTATGDASNKVINNCVSIEIVDLPEIEDVSVSGYSEVYDGAAHTLSVSIPDGAEISYSTDNIDFSGDAPMFTNVGENIVYYKVTMEGHKDKTGRSTVSITQKELSESMIEAITAQRYTGNKIRPEITVTDGTPSIITTDDYTVSYGENINVATGGSVTINGKGNYKGTASKTFIISPVVMTVSKNDYNETYDGAAHNATVEVTMPANSEIKYGTEYGVYTLSEMPKYTNVGEYTVYFKATADNYSDYTGSVKVNITQKELSDSMVENINSQDYTGNQIKPAVTVTDGTPSIITANDYDLIYGENINVATGGSITINGKGNYKGSVVKTFLISPIAFPAGSITENDYTGVFDGTAHRATVTIPDGATVKYGTNGSNCSSANSQEYINVGTYIVYYLVSKPNYNDFTGSIEVNITQKELSDSMIQSITAQEYTGSQIKPSITVTDGTPSIITADDYAVSYGENTNVSTGGSVTITGKGNYKGTASKTFTISPAVMTVSKSDYNGTYDGAAHKATVEATTPANSEIKYGTEDGVYTLSEMPKYTNANEYTVYFKATAANYSDYTGSVNVNIAQKKLSADMIGSIATQIYTGSQIKPQITVTDGSPNIITTNDYDVSYGENTNVSTGGSVTITGKGNYKGTASKNFTISPAIMSVSKSDYNGMYDGVAHKAMVNVTTPANAEIKYGTSDGIYILNEMPEYKNAGEYTVYFKASADNYSDYTGSVNVNITQKELSDSMVENITAQEYTGNQIKPVIAVTDGTPSIITASDYDISYGENTNVSAGGSVTVTGKGNYKGSVIKNFEISNVILKAEAKGYTGIYDGKPHKVELKVLNNENATIKYGTAEGEYTLDTMPEYTNVGNYTVYYKATADNYSDCTGNLAVVISPKTLTEDMVGDVAGQTYISEQITPAVTVTDGEPTIISDLDYDISYGENINAADGGSITVTAKKNYTGSITRNFTINKAELKVSAESKIITYGETFEIAVSYNGFVGTETKAVLTVEATVSGFESSPKAGEYDIILSDAAADNYNIVYEGMPKLTVNKRNISISELKVFDKLYDENKKAKINETTAVFDGILGADVVVLDASGATAEFASAEVGDDISVSVTGLKIKGDSAENYNLTNTGFTSTASIKDSMTSENIAQQITGLTVDRYMKNLVMPSVPNGYKITLKSSSDEAIVAADGTIYLSDTDKFVDLVFTVTNEAGDDIAQTAIITVKIPAGEKKQITVLSDSNGTVTGGGDFLKSTEITVNAIPNSGYEFEGWYDGENLISSAANYTFTVEKTITLTAKFKVKQTSRSGGSSIVIYTVAFETNGGGSIAGQKVKRNAIAAEPELPVKDGYTFEGWYSDKSLTKVFDFSSKITGNITLYAKWKEIEAGKKEWQNMFSDVNEKAWYYEAVKYTNENGLLKGISENTFAPDAALSRAMLVTVLYRAENEPETETASKFSDVESNQYYFKAVAWAEKNNIVSGYSETEFMPDDNITREQFAVIMYKYAAYNGNAPTGAWAIRLDYADLTDISDWAAEAVMFCKLKGLMNGNDRNEFKPHDNATRAEAAAILQRFFEEK